MSHKTEEKAFELSYRVSPDFPCPIIVAEQAKGESCNLQCKDYTKEQSGCDQNELRALIPHGYPCHRVDDSGVMHCIPREIPGLVEAINNSQYFRWNGKIVKDEVAEWIELYYKSKKDIKPNLKLHNLVEEATG